MTNLLRAGRVALMLLCVVTAAAEVRADVKIKSRQTMQGQSYDNATYIKGKRQRTESMGGQSVTIQQCDLRRDIQIMTQMRAYTVRPYDEASAQTSSAPASGTRQTVARTQGGLVTSTITTKDTGERKQIFGYTARHLIITIETKSSPDSCNPVDTKMETDGWYIDAAFQLDCDIDRAGHYYNPQQTGGCRDRYQTKQVGTGKRGFPLWEKMRMFDKDGRESFSMVNEVVELSQATLDASLFEAPADYREVKDFSAAALMTSSDPQQTSDTGMSTKVRDLAGPQTEQAPAELGAKKPGVVRLGLADVKTGAVGEGLSAADLASNVMQKDELTLDIKLQAPGTPAPATSRQFKSKARSAGEDIITPVVEQAAQMILDASAKG